MADDKINDGSPENLSLGQIHELAVGEWHSNRPGSDGRFCALIDEIESRFGRDEFNRYRLAFPDIDAGGSA